MRGRRIWQTPDHFDNDDRDDAYLHNGRYEKFSGPAPTFSSIAQWILSRAQERNQPFFCYIPTAAAHEPTWALASDTEPYTNVPGLANPGFYGMIANIDANLGRLRKFLDSRGLGDNTILLYAGDNGG